jgi:aspartyl-tRNA(Asn)/glutamyl-tRNA(Gln) amidotransferase subunit B
MFASGEAAAAIVEREGTAADQRHGALEQIVDQVLQQNPKQVEQYKSGKTTVLGFLVGQVMKASRGQANPGRCERLAKEETMLKEGDTAPKIQLETDAGEPFDLEMCGVRR